MSGKGGKRPGAGRPKGARNKTSAKREQMISESGLTPLDYMLKVLRSRKSTPEMKRWAASSAAAYCHPRLNSVNLSGGVTVSHEQALDELDEPPAED